MVSETLSRMGYARARQLLLGTGLAVLVITALVMYVRRVDPVEVAATLLFIPVFLSFVFWDVRGGLIAGALAAGAYVLLRSPAIDAVGIDRFVGLIASRSIAYLVFGAIGGYADKQLEMSLNKLELFDQIDDATGLYNSRFFVETADLEMGRSDRYQSIFSISLVDIPADALYQLGRKQRDKVIREISRLLRDSVRTVDRVVHARDGNKHRFAIFLPETGVEGADIFTARLVENLKKFLAERGARIEGPLESKDLTYPEDDAAVKALKDEFAALSATQHPVAAKTPAVGTSPPASPSPPASA